MLLNKNILVAITPFDKKKTAKFYALAKLIIVVAKNNLVSS